MLVHDLLVNPDGLSLSKNHALRETVSKHKTRLSAEFTRVRLGKGYSSFEALRAAIAGGHYDYQVSSTSTQNTVAKASIPTKRPRWLRINTIRTSLKQQLHTTFANFTHVASLEDLSANPHTIFIDAHVPDLIAVHPRWQASNHSEYRKGSLILQDKASCFPALLLDPRSDSKCLDACAAPGNKTTHLASLMYEHGYLNGPVRIWASEKDASRAKILDQMIKLAGAENLVNVQAGKDFLRIDPNVTPWSAVTHLLLDPSCSGSGIIGRDEELNVILPSITTGETEGRTSKRQRKSKPKLLKLPQHEVVDAVSNGDKGEAILEARLSSLSSFQIKLLLHAFAFPKAERITYSTCSIYPEENEHVVIEALLAPIAKERGWRILLRHEQPKGLEAWHIRGNKESCDLAVGNESGLGAEEVAGGCIRCDKGTADGTQGFFVASFVRNASRDGAPLNTHEKNLDTDDEVWNGFDDDT